MTLSRLADAVTLDPDFAHLEGNVARRVIAASTFDRLERAEPGDLVVLDDALHDTVGSYRYDLALGRAPDGLAGVLGGEPSSTGRRTAASRHIAIGALSANHDVASLAVLLRDLDRGGMQADVAVVERLYTATEHVESVDGIDQLLVVLRGLLGCGVTLSRQSTTATDLPLRVQGLIRWYLVVDTPPRSTLLRTALSHAARHVEAALQADFEARALPDATRSELLTEILQTDAGTSAAAVSRLRRSGYPIDGSHCAIRIDAADATTTEEGADLTAAFGARQRLAELALEAARRTGGTWARAGTAGSILLISSQQTPRAETVSPQAERAATAIIREAGAALPELDVHLGVGSVHPGAAGLRTSVDEATIAARSARDRGLANQAHFFDRLGLRRALLRWAEIDGVRPVISELLTPLLEQPEGRAREALTTLRTYLETGRSVSATADALHLHRNTVRYRLDRIGKLLPVDLDDPEERLLLELACRLVTAEWERWE